MNRLLELRRFLIRIAAVLMAGLPLAASGAPNFDSLPFALDGVQDRIVPVDLDGDGLRDFLTADGHELRAYFQRSQSPVFEFAKPDSQLTLPGSATGWDIEYSDGGAGRLLALVDGKRLLAWPIIEGKFDKPLIVMDQLQGDLPAGAYPMAFVRDVNGDEQNDIIVPSVDSLALYLRTAPGEYAPPLTVNSPVNNRAELSSSSDLQRSVGQRVRIPKLRIRDLNSDGYRDLISVNERHLQVFLAQEDGRLVSQPSYELDREAIESRLGEVDYDKIDYSNLSGLLSYTYEFELSDLDGDGIEDLMVREAGRVIVYGGTAEGMNMEKPRQILKSAGNVLGAILRDEDGDGRKDLWLTRLEDISVGNIFVWLAVSGSVDTETFIYRNKGDRFARRPHRKITVSLEFPSIFRSADMVMDALDSPADTDTWRTVRAVMDGDGKQNDLVKLQTDELTVYINAVPQENSAEAILGVENYRPDKDEYEVDWGKILANPTRMANRDLQAIADQKPAFSVPLSGEDESQAASENRDLMSVDFNKDGIDDIVVFNYRSDKHVRGVLLLSK